MQLAGDLAPNANSLSPTERFALVQRSVLRQWRVVVGPLSGRRCAAGPLVDGRAGWPRYRGLRGSEGVGGPCSGRVSGDVGCVKCAECGAPSEVPPVARTHQSLYTNPGRFSDLRRRMGAKRVGGLARREGPSHGRASEARTSYARRRLCPASARRHHAGRTGRVDGWDGLATAIHMLTPTPAWQAKTYQSSLFSGR